MEQLRTTETFNWSCLLSKRGLGGRGDPICPGHQTACSTACATLFVSMGTVAMIVFESDATQSKGSLVTIATHSSSDKSRRGTLVSAVSGFLYFCGALSDPLTLVVVCAAYLTHLAQIMSAVLWICKKYGGGDTFVCHPLNLTNVSFDGVNEVTQ